ncbi:hypothetical protein BMR86_25895, partial [Stenotrophomonas sp. KAs 5-3]
PLLAPSALEALAQYAFPGNVRELENILERALARSHGRATPLLAPSALEALAQYAFPGNVRELENILERALA